MIYLALFAFLLVLFITLVVAGGAYQIPCLGNLSFNRDATALPSVSVIIPACNEEEALVPALTSVLHLGYDNLEVIVVNDRSTDKTGLLLEQMQERFPALKVETVRELPSGWLGKNHALQYGADRAGGEYLLFTDADVVMEASTLARAIQHMIEKDLDHLSLIFELTVPGGLLNTMMLDVGGMLLFLYKPWQASDPASKYFMGVGAFNLVRTETYKRIGCHERIRMCPVDDIQLGRIIKQGGYKQECLNGSGFVMVRWYAAVGEMIQGLMKNSFAVYDYSLLKVCASVVLQCLVGVLPLWGVLISNGYPRLLFGAALLFRFLAFFKAFADNGIRPWYAIWSLVVSYLSIYITMKAAVQTIIQGGIYWRNSFYSLKELRQQIRENASL